MKNGELKIEKGIPIPSRRRTGISDTFRKMKAGDSVLITTARTSLYTIAARAWGPNSCTVRAEGNAVRVWRTK